VNVYIVHREVPYEPGTDLGVTDDLALAKKIAQEHSDESAKTYGRASRKIRWSRTSSAPNYWWGDDGQYDSYSIARWKVTSK
jgi:hypothetical protein